MSKRAIVLELTELAPDERRELQAVSERLALAANEYVDVWLGWHRAHESREKLAVWLHELREWHQQQGGRWPRYRREDTGKKSPKPQCPVEFSTPELDRELYLALSRHHAKTHGKVIGMLMNFLRSKLTTKGDANLSEWIEVLLHRRGRPQFLHGVPINLHKQNTQVFTRQVERRRGTGTGQNTQGEAQTATQLCLRFRVDRIEVDGQKHAASTELICGLRAEGKRRAYADPIWKIAEAGGKGVAVKLLYRHQRRKWFAAFTVDDVSQPAAGLDPHRIAVVAASKLQPFTIRVTGKSLRHGYEAEHVAQTRQKLAAQRLSRQNFYRLGAGSARKGRGRKRAIQDWEGKLSYRWKCFMKTCSEGWAASLAKRLALMGVGKVILIQPTDAQRFLDVAGRVSGNESVSGWDWTQWLTLAAAKCTRQGIQVVKVKDSFHRRRQKASAADRVA